MEKIPAHLSRSQGLYVSPARSATPTHKNTSPYKWVRQDFEKSSPEVDSTRQSLLLKLDECSRGYVYSPNVSRNSNDTVASLSPIDEARPPSPTIPQIKQQLRDIRTITASKWSSASSPSRSGTLTPSTPLDESFLRRKESDDADDEDEDSYKLQDMTDVQVMARIQEESLRQELSPRRLSSPRQRPDTLQYDDGDPFPEDEYESPRNLYYSPRDSRSSSRSQSPQRHLADSPRNQSPKIQRKQYYTNEDSRSGSSNLSGSNSSLHSTPVNGEGREKQPLRRSMPNLTKSTTTNQQSSPIRSSQNQESKLRTPTSTGNPAVSQSGLRQPQLRQSGSGIPRGTGIPTRQSPQAKSGIPRPGQRRGIPVPKSEEETEDRWDQGDEEEPGEFY
ncbi:SLAIN motif member 2 [Branchiostoma belcheri]|nr:SLAIN motif member 2 [Branchiostoma belcheri]